MKPKAISTVLILGFIPTAGLAEQTKACPPGQIDVLDWATLDADLRGSKHLSGPQNRLIYTVVQPDKYYWLKTSNGDTWDINLYDDIYIFQWITELSYHTPTDYKRYTYDTNVPWMFRCATPGLPGEYITIPNTTFEIATNCQENTTTSVGNARVEFWGPYTAGKPGLESWRAPIGGDIPNSTPVYVVAWYWDCDTFYDNCSVKEEYMLAQRYGLVEWTSNSLQNGTYVVDATHPFNRLENGSASPYFPCF